MGGLKRIFKTHLQVSKVELSWLIPTLPHPRKIICHVMFNILWDSSKTDFEIDPRIDPFKFWCQGTFALLTCFYNVIFWAQCIFANFKIYHLYFEAPSAGPQCRAAIPLPVGATAHFSAWGYHHTTTTTTTTTYHHTTPHHHHKHHQHNHHPFFLSFLGSFFPSLVYTKACLGWWWKFFLKWPLSHAIQIIFILHVLRVG